MTFTYRDVVFKNESGNYVSKNLQERYGYELSIRIGEHEAGEYERVLSWLSDYLLDCEPVIKPNETIAFGSWLLKFVERNSVYEIHELLPDGNDYILGADYAISIITDQERLCCEFDTTTADFPNFNEMIAVSEGVLEGYKVEAWRFAYDAPVTGWYIISELYDGDHKKMKTIHFSHLALSRPELLKYLALPAGYTIFEDETGIEVSFDPSLLKE